MSVSRRLRNRWTDWALGVWTGIALFFLFVPVITAVVYAFNEGRGGKQLSTFTHFTTRWFSAAWQDDTLRGALTTSLRVAVGVAVVAALLGTATGIAMARHPSASIRAVLQTLVYLLLIVPEVVLGSSLLLFYTELEAHLSLTTLVAAHTPTTIALVALVVRSRVVALDRQIEESGADLGGRPWQIYRDIVLPQLFPAIMAGTILAFAYSFDNVVISQFLITPNINTLPVFLFSSISHGVSPMIYATAAMMLAFTLTMFLLAGIAYWALNPGGVARLRIARVVRRERGQLAAAERVASAP